MYSIVRKSATLFIASSIFVGGVTPVLAQYSCPPRDIQTSDESKGIKFEAQGCQRQGKKVVCSVWLTAIEKNIDNINILRSTRLIDSDGNTYIPNAMKAGAQEAGSNLFIRLTKDTPIKLTSTFIDIASSVRDVSLLEISTQIYPINPIGKLRNLKITEGRAESTQVPANPPQKKKK